MIISIYRSIYSCIESYRIIFWGIGKYRIAGYENRYRIESWWTIRFTPIIYTHIHVYIYTYMYSVIQPIALCGSEVWGPLSDQSYSRWDRHPTEALDTEFCKMILKLQRKTPNNACRAELGQFPLIISMHKRSLKFWMHLKSSPTESLHFKALQTPRTEPRKESTQSAGSETY